MEECRNLMHSFHWTVEIGDIWINICCWWQQLFPGIQRETAGTLLIQWVNLQPLTSMTITNGDVNYTKFWESMFLMNVDCLNFHRFVELMATNTRQNTSIVKNTQIQGKWVSQHWNLTQNQNTMWMLWKSWKKILVSVKVSIIHRYYKPRKRCRLKREKKIEAKYYKDLNTLSFLLV